MTLALGACTMIFYGRNLWLVFVHGKPFQPNLMFAVKAGAYPSEALRCCTLG
jgi:hypothetical protein